MVCICLRQSAFVAFNELFLIVLFSHVLFLQATYGVTFVDDGAT